METRIRTFSLPSAPTVERIELKKGLRHATLDDLPEIFELAKDLFTGSPMEGMRFSPRKIQSKILQAVSSGFEDYLVIVAEDEGKIVGALAAYCYEPIWSDQKIACEVLWHVKPEYRKGRRGLDMMDAYEAWAKSRGCVFAQYGILSSSPQTMPALYEKRGCVLAEHIYYKAV